MELEQLVCRKVMEGHKANDLTTAQKKAALHYLMFLKPKQCGWIKGCGCANGQEQWIYKTKEDTSSPTTSTEALFLTCLTDAVKGQHMITCDVPGAFMQTDIDKMLHLKLEGEIAQLLIRLDPSCTKFATRERGRLVYMELSKALYGTLQATMLFWKDLSTFLTNELGFIPNPYDWCVIDKVINGDQCTIRWHVDNLKISHVDEATMESIVDTIGNKY